MAQLNNRLKLKHEALTRENQDLQEVLSDKETKIRQLEADNTKNKRNRELQLQNENEKLATELKDLK